VNAQAPVSAQAWCTFQIAGGHYGIELARVQEVLRPLPVTRLPLGPPAIAGLINLRGRIVTVVDARAVLGVGEPGTPAAGLIVVRGGEGPVALLVDAIGDVRRPTSPPALAAEPAADERGSLVACTLALPGELLVVLDLDRLLARAFAAPAEARS